MVEWRERPVAVIDIAGLAGLAPLQYQHQTRILIVRPGAGLEVIGVPVKTAIRWQTLPLPHQPSERELPRDLRHVRAMFQVGAEVLLIPDFGQFGRPAPTS
jgi:chemotaxis signal transduction protein